MRASKWLAIMRQLLLLSGIVAIVSGCDAAANGSLPHPSDGPQAAAPGFALAPPSTLRSTSEAQISLDGKGYNGNWPHNRVTRITTHASYTPQYADPNRTLLDAAYAIYALDVSSFTGAAKLYFSFDACGEHGAAWVGLADFSKDRWDWYPMLGPADSQGRLDLALADRNNGGVMPVALVFIGTDTWDLVGLHLGQDAQPGPWPMAGKDSNHTFRTTDAGPRTKNVLWKFHTLGPGVRIIGMAMDPDGALYISAGDGVYAFNADGTSRWDCMGLNPLTAPAVGPDGTVYVGGCYPNAGLHAISNRGVRKWRYVTTDDVDTTPAVSPDGCISFMTYAAALSCVWPTGTLRWQKQLESSCGCSPAVDANGVIYIGYMTKDFNPVGYLMAIEPDGVAKWNLSTGSPCRTRPAIAPDGSIVYSTKSGSVVALNPDASTKWSAGGGGPYTTPAIDADGVVYVCGSELTALAGDSGSKLWSAGIGGMATGGPGLSPDGELIAATTDTGVITICGRDGAKLCSIETGSEFWWIDPMAGNGIVYAADAYSHLYCYTPDGVRRMPEGVGGPVACSPVTAADGTIYFGSEDTYLYAMWPDGRLKWRYITGGGIDSSPLVRPDGTILVGSKDYFLHAVNPDGTPLWKFECGNFVEGSPALGPDGKIYFGSLDRSLYCLNPDGTLCWAFTHKWNVTGAPTVDSDGKVYFGCWDYNLYCLNADGSLDWTYLTEGPVRGSIALEGDRLYAACERDTYTGRVYSLTKEGKLVWRYYTGGTTSMSPCVSADGTVYIATAPREMGRESAVYALKDHRPVWHYETISLAAGLALDGNGVVYAGTADGRMLALQNTETLMEVLWEYSVPDAIFYTPAISGGRAYVGYNNGIYAFGED
jgi:outer membrane protein assembly factor BamB